MNSQVLLYIWTFWNSNELFARFWQYWIRQFFFKINRIFVRAFTSVPLVSWLIRDWPQNPRVNVPPKEIAFITATHTRSAQVKYMAVTVATSHPFGVGRTTGMSASNRQGHKGPVDVDGERTMVKGPWWKDHDERTMIPFEMLRKGLLNTEDNYILPKHVSLCGVRCFMRNVSYWPDCANDPKAWWCSYL